MSVAFRRESDEEHLEPKFEIPIPPGPNLVTPRGLQLIHEKVTELEALLPRLTEQAHIDATKRDLRYWQTRQTTAQLVPRSNGETVAFGSKVTFRLNGNDRTLTIVGHDEGDPARDLVSLSAPLVRAMIGAQAGEFVAFGGKPEAIEIVAIDPQG
jgi:transcription elongation GreA/GreB family factor